MILKVLLFVFLNSLFTISIFLFQKEFHQLETDIKIIAHRGFSSKFPENTVRAVKEAAHLGVHYIEIDVHQSADGHVIVIHDETVDRTTNSSGRVDELTLDQLKAFDAGSWKDEQFSGEKIPVLEDILPFISSDTKLLLEVKKGNTYYEGIEERILQILNEFGIKQNVVIQSFYTPVLERFRELDNEIELHKLGVYQAPRFPFHIDYRPRLGRMYKLDFITHLNLHYKFCNRRILHQINRHNLKTIVWTVNDPDDMKKMINSGVNGIITDHPDVLIKLIKEQKAL